MRGLVPRIHVFDVSAVPVGRESRNAESVGWVEPALGAKPIITGKRWVSLALNPSYWLYWLYQDEQDVDGRDKRGHDDLESPFVESRD